MFQLDTHTLAQIPPASVFIFPSSLIFAHLCLYIIDSFGVALIVCFTITFFWVTAQEDTDMARKEHKVKGRQAFHSSHTVRGTLHHLEWYVCA